MYPYQRYAGFLAVFAAILYAALVVGVFGYLSLLTETDVIGADIGVAVGPLMVAASALYMLAVLLTNALRTPADQQRLSPLRALGVALGAFAVFLLTGALLASLGEEPVSFVVFLGDMLARPHAIAIAVIAFAVTLVVQWMLVLRINEKGRPRWPWERDDDV